MAANVTASDRQWVNNGTTDRVLEDSMLAMVGAGIGGGLFLVTIVIIGVICMACEAQAQTRAEEQVELGGSTDQPVLEASLLRRYSKV